MKIQLLIWRQAQSATEGKLLPYDLDDISPDMSFLEMLDHLNEILIGQNEDPIAFDNDCREGICGTCSLTINGVPHGNDHKTRHSAATTACQIHMRRFNDGDTIVVEPWRAIAFPVVKDLVVDRSALERIIQSGGYISINTGTTVDANQISVPKARAEKAMDAAQCIGCGACVAACPNASAMLFVAAKVSHLALLPQGEHEKLGRVQNMIAQMDRENFGNCSNHYECESVCPKEISINFISRLNREYLYAAFMEPIDNET